MGVKIRKARKTDYQHILDLVKKYPKIIVEPYPKWRKYFVAADNKKIIGCCALEIYSPKIAEVRSIAVIPKYGKKGIGKQLIAKCLEITEKRDVHEVFVVTSIPKYFNKLGFDFVQGEKYILFKR